MMQKFIQSVKHPQIAKQLKILTVPPYYAKNYSPACEEQVLQKLQQNLEHAEEFYPTIQEISKAQMIKETNLFQIYWTWILPFYQQLLKDKTDNKPVMLKCLGVPGVGKTAFGSILQGLADFDKKTVLSASTDDFYLEYEQRKSLKEKDPRYTARGPPGTSDFKLLEKVVESVKMNSENIEVPVFEKCLHKGEGDRARYNKIDHKVDIFVLEGWYTGCRYQPETPEFLNKLTEIVKDEKKIEFALEQNSLLKQHHQIWDQFDRQLVLTPLHYKSMFDYRLEAEHKLIKKKGTGLSDAKIYELMSYFYDSLCPEIYINDMIKSGHVDLLVKFDVQRNLISADSFM